jgi:hypothetical protein
MPVRLGKEVQDVPRHLKAQLHPGHPVRHRKTVAPANAIVGMQPCLFATLSIHALRPMQHCCAPCKLTGPNRKVQAECYGVSYASTRETTTPLLPYQLPR